MKTWKCPLCNYVHHGDEPPLRCPLCGETRANFREQ